MSIAYPDSPTLADLMEDLGVGADRIHLQPPPGTATEADVIALCDQNVYCELIDGVLVEKAVGQHESRLSMWIGYFLLCWIEAGNDLGVVHGSDAPHRLFADQIRYPDVAFVRYERLPEGQRSREPIASWVPNLAVEVISASNTPKEMRLKLVLYFASGVELVWYVYPARRTVDVYTSADQVTTLGEGDVLEGSTVLPGFQLLVTKLFEKAD